MARRYRVEAGREANKQELQELIGSFSPYQEELLNALESGEDKDIDALLNAVQGRFGNETESVKSRIKELSKKLPENKDALKKFLDSQTQGKDESVLTDDELRERQEAFGGLSGQAEDLDRNAVKTRINNLLSSNKVIPQLLDINPGEDNLSNILTDFVTKNRRLPDYFEFEKLGRDRNVNANLLRQIKENGAFRNLLTNQEVANDIGGLTTKIDSSADVKRIQDILSSRMTESQKQAALDQFLAETPEELRGNREDYLASQEQMGAQYLRDRVVPNVLNELNRRGTIESPGEFASALSSEAGGIQARIEEQARSLENDDALFFADAAYRLKLSRLESSELDYRTQVAAERSRVRNEQGQGFASKEGSLARDFETDLLRREQDRNLRLRRSELDFSGGQAADATRSSLLSDVSSSGASIIGSKLIYGGRTSEKPTPSETAGGAKPAPIKPVPSIIGR